MSHIGNVALRRRLFVLTCIAIITVCASLNAATLPSPCFVCPDVHDDCKLPEKGYLPIEALPDSVELLPHPPAAYSADLVFDKEVSRKNLHLKDTPRWKQAKEDADLNYIRAVDAFSRILNVPINKQDTPKLYELLRKIAADANNSTKRAKEKYKRPRPFQENKKPICTPCDEKSLKGNGSYPSGHTAIGWAWALILAEIAPEKTDALHARGLAFGESRVVCNVHWQSDVNAGRLIGAVVIDRLLHADTTDPEFRKDLNDAKDEFKAIRAKEGIKSKRDNKSEKGSPVH